MAASPCSPRWKLFLHCISVSGRLSGEELVSASSVMDLSLRDCGAPLQNSEPGEKTSLFFTLRSLNSFLLTRGGVGSPEISRLWRHLPKIVSGLSYVWLQSQYSSICPYKAKMQLSVYMPESIGVRHSASTRDELRKCSVRRVCGILQLRPLHT